MLRTQNTGLAVQLNNENQGLPALLKVDFPLQNLVPKPEPWYQQILIILHCLANLNTSLPTPKWHQGPGKGWHCWWQNSLFISHQVDDFLHHRAGTGGKQWEFRRAAHWEDSLLGAFLLLSLTITALYSHTGWGSVRITVSAQCCLLKAQRGI